MITALNRASLSASSARLSMVGDSSSRNLALLTCQRNCSICPCSSPCISSHQAGGAYIIHTTAVAHVTSWKARLGILCCRSILRANKNEAQLPSVLLTCSVTVKFSPILTPKIFMMLLSWLQWRTVARREWPVHVVQLPSCRSVRGWFVNFY